jgi:regulator of sigma D
MFESLGGIATLLLLLLLVIFFFVRRAFNEAMDNFRKRLDRFEQALTILEKAALSEEGQAISQAKQLEIINKVFDDLRAHSQKCLDYHDSLGKAHNDLSELRSDIEKFSLEGHEARQFAQDAVTKLGNRLDTFMEKILEIIRNLSDFGARRGDN